MIGKKRVYGGLNDVSDVLTGFEDDIQFGHEFLRYEKKDGKVTTHFAGGLTEEGDVIVGADGISSQIRQQYLPSNCPLDTCVRIIYEKTTLTPDLVQKFNKDASECRTCQRLCILGITCWFSGLELFSYSSQQILVAELSLEITKDWDSSIRSSTN